jgi:hypothetical protein
LRVVEAQNNPTSVGLALGQAIGTDAQGVIHGIEAQTAAVIRGATYAAHNPGGAAAILNDHPYEVGQILGETAAALTTAKILSTPDRLYRAVDTVEFSDLQQTGSFQPGGNSVNGKYFAETPEHAAQWGKLMIGNGNYKIVQAEVSSNVPNMRWSSLDRIGPARFYEADDLTQITYRGVVKR